MNSVAQIKPATVLDLIAKHSKKHCCTLGYCCQPLSMFFKNMLVYADLITLWQVLTKKL